MSTDDELLEETHYYPYGMAMDGPWMSVGSMDYGYNGVEYEDFMGLDMNLATYRGLDPALGRWCQVDPKAESYIGLSPYNSMGNNPISIVDPEGDFFFVAALGPLLSGIVSGAIVGAGINGTITAATGGNFLDGAWKGAITGALGGGLGAIGGGNFAANLALGTGEGALTGGIGSVLNGGNFLEGAKWGAIAGAIATTATSENLKNAFKGEGFKTNSNVFDAMIERGAGKQSIIDHFGMDATFDASMSADAKFWYKTDGSDYGINLGESAFDSYDVLKSNYLKESFHMNRYLSGDIEYVPNSFTPQMKLGLEEYAGAKWNYRNQGLYSRSPTIYYDIIKNVESHYLSPFGTAFNSYNKKWWHFIYKIPRRY